MFKCLNFSSPLPLRLVFLAINILILSTQSGCQPSSIYMQDDDEPSPIALSLEERINTTSSYGETYTLLDLIKLFDSIEGKVHNGCEVVHKPYIELFRMSYENLRSELTLSSGIADKININELNEEIKQLMFDVIRREILNGPDLGYNKDKAQKIIDSDGENYTLRDFIELKYVTQDGSSLLERSYFSSEMPSVVKAILLSTGISESTKIHELNKVTRKHIFYTVGDILKQLGTSNNNHEKEECRKILRHLYGKDLNIIDVNGVLDPSEYGNTILMWDIAMGRVYNQEFALMLLKNFQANPFIKDNNNKNALHFLLLKNHMVQQSVLNAILDHPDIRNYINEPTIFGDTPLHIACAHRNVKFIKMLLDHGAQLSLNLRNNKGQSPRDMLSMTSEQYLVFLGRKEYLEELCERYSTLGKIHSLEVVASLNHNILDNENVSSDQEREEIENIIQSYINI